MRHPPSRPLLLLLSVAAIATSSMPSFGCTAQQVAIGECSADAPTQPGGGEVNIGFGTEKPQRTAPDPDDGTQRGGDSGSGGGINPNYPSDSPQPQPYPAPKP